jgi:hypothetical protein
MPIVNVAGVGKIEFPDSMTPEQIDAAIKTDILPIFEGRAAAPSSTVASAVSPAPPASTIAQETIAPNPFSKGTAAADPNFKIGDRYRYRVIDMLTKLESREDRRRIVTDITDTEVIFNRGNLITDPLGNILQNNRGQTFTGSQIFVAEYRVGRKWNTTYRGTRRDLNPDVWSLDFKVVARESITVPAGTFDAFKVEGDGYVSSRGNHFRITYWIAPDKVRSFIALEETKSGGGGRKPFAKTDRTELVGFRQS